MEKIEKKRLHSLIAILLFLVPTASLNVYEHIQMERMLMCSQLRTELTQQAFGILAGGTEAKSIYTYDFSKNFPLYAKDENTARPLASLTKLMTVRLALEKDSPLDFYTVQKEDLGSDGFAGFAEGDSYRISDLVAGALIESINNSAVMLARSTGLSDTDFVAQMNIEAKRLNLPSLQFGNPTGLDANNETVATAYGSARDILLLLKYDYDDFPDMIALSTHTEDRIKAMNGRTLVLKNTDLAIDKLPLLLASKTGYTDTAGGNLAVLWQEPSGDVLGASILGSSPIGRFTDMIAIHDASDAYLKSTSALPTYCTSS